VKLSGLFDRRVRGFRVVELGALAVLLALVLAVYLSKSGANGERADIDHTQEQIDNEKIRIRLLQAEVANLERPERLEALATQYLGMQPISIKHEIAPDALPDLTLTITRNDIAEAKAKAATPVAPNANGAAQNAARATVSDAGDR
jgi:cell division protein FtsL